MASAFAIQVAPWGRPLLRRIEVVARSQERPVSSLHLQALLQLPRIADANGFVAADQVDALLNELVNELPIASEWFVCGVSSYSPKLLTFHEVGLDQAREIMSSFHYLRSPRLDGRYYGLSSSEGRLVAICVSSPLDVEYLHNLLRLEGRDTQDARVLSRVFAFEGAPRNTISHLMSRAAQAERKLGVTDWVSYVNPNMGFSGVSYLASDWHLLGEQPGTTYRYLDNRYITDRELSAKFGYHNDDTYNRVLGERFAKNRMQLEPLLVFYRRLAQKNFVGSTGEQSKQLHKLHSTTPSINRSNPELKKLIAR